MPSPRTIPDSWKRVDIRLWGSTRRRDLPRDLLICGRAGTGKTFGVLRWIHCLCRDNANLRVLVARKTRAALTDSVLVTFEQEILPLDGLERIAYGTQRRIRHSYLYPNGSEIVLAGLDKPERALSQAWDIAFVNEAIECREEDWETLASRMSRPGRPTRLGYLIGDTNPGHPEHWLKKRCEAGRTVLWDTTHEANPAMFDGRDWTEAGKRYRVQLDALTGTRRKRLRDGEWAVGEGLWFDSFDPAKHVAEAAEYDPALPAFLAIDPGVSTGAVFFQVRSVGSTRFANVFGDYFAEGKTVEGNATALKQLADSLCNGRIGGRYCDPAGGARNPIGPTVMAEYAKAGLPLQPWAAANPSVSDSLQRVEVMLNPIGGEPRLTIHPRCRNLISAFANYKRAKRQDQWQDYPEDPQHPAEDMIDALRGGLYRVVGKSVDKLFL